MAQKRIKMTRYDPISERMRILYDDGTQGELNMDASRYSVSTLEGLTGLTLKQAKMKLGIKK